ncbi:hypothetical protein [Flavobacterium sp. M31R6]|uniref:hypothetical protein n=1 Tax=Flavobacterium sp. M31R6 TaxID=2739062 RepID=UPI00156A1E8B|nr:hypothetical protein [Flavobacterium sp. M31R6]QKJ63957.1 hypothetical protein HQN62_12750 [Flavobacterium sp. M31R6]
MKTIKLFIIAILFFTVSSTKAQVSVDVNIGTPNVNVHVGTPPPPPAPAPVPVWGPVGYDEVEYYYLPDIQVYYDIRLAQYIYFGNGKWIRSRYLPSHCRNYDLYHGYKVVLTDYHGHTPYTYFNTHKVKYYKGYKGKPQKSRGEYQVRYDDHDHHDNDNHNDHHGNDHHDNHGEKGHNGKGKH